MRDWASLNIFLPATYNIWSNMVEIPRIRKAWSNVKLWCVSLITVALLHAITLVSSPIRDSSAAAESGQQAQSEGVEPGCSQASEQDTPISGEAFIQSESEPGRIVTLERLTGDATWCEHHISVAGIGHRNGDPAAGSAWTISYNTETDELEFGFDADRKSWHVLDAAGGIRVVFRPADRFFMAQFLSTQEMNEHAILPGSVIRIAD